MAAQEEQRGEGCVRGPANTAPWLSRAAHPLHPLHPFRALPPTWLRVWTPAYALLPLPQPAPPYTPPCLPLHSPENPFSLPARLSLTVSPAAFVLNLTVPLSPPLPGPVLPVIQNTGQGPWGRRLKPHPGAPPADLEAIKSFSFFSLTTFKL